MGSSPSPGTCAKLVFGAVNGLDLDDYSNSDIFNHRFSWNGNYLCAISYELYKTEITGMYGSGLSASLWKRVTRWFESNHPDLYGVYRLAAKTLNCEFSYRGFKSH